MKTALKTLFLAFSICCVHVALPSESDFSYFTEPELERQIEFTKSLISVNNEKIQENKLELQKIEEEKREQEEYVSKAISALNARHLERGG